MLNISFWKYTVLILVCIGLAPKASNGNNDKCFIYKDFIEELVSCETDVDCRDSLGEGYCHKKRCFLMKPAGIVSLLSLSF